MQVNYIIQTVLFVILLSAAAYTDVKKREIPDGISLLIAIVSLLEFSAVHLLGILAALPFLVAARIDSPGLGGGDIKLTAAVGLVLGFGSTLLGLTIGLTTLIIFHGVMNFFVDKESRGAKTKGYPLAPFLMIGFMCAYFI